MAPTTAVDQATGVAPATPPPASPGAPVTAAGTATPPRPPQADYSLLAPPNYDSIVGGVAPSPLVSMVLLLGLAALIAAAIGAAGLATGEWWALGAIFIGVAALLAGFVSRSA